MTLRKGTWNALFFYAKNVKGDSFNVVTIHPAVTGRATFICPGMNVLEYSGAEKTSPLVTDIAGTEGSLPGTWSSSPFNAAAGKLVVMGIVTAKAALTLRVLDSRSRMHTKRRPAANSASA